MDRNSTIARIRTGLKARSGKSWSVTGGTGTAYGWIRIGVTPRQAQGRPEWKAELAQLLGKDRVHSGGESIPPSNAYYQEYIDRAEGRTPIVIGTTYWD